MPKLFFLGPKGTYSEVAAIKALEFLKDKYVLSPVSTIPKIVDLVNKDASSCAILPYENSIEGIVRATIDNIYMQDTKIQAEIDIKIEHCLISKTGEKEKIKHIISHPQALSQCSKYILENFDENIDIIASNSTAEACYSLQKYDGTFSAIGSSKVAEDLKYEIIDKNIGDIKENKTRFVLISKNDMNLSKKNRSTIAFNTKNEEGALLRVLQILYNYNLNLIYLESRPSKKVFGEYTFFADIDKNISESQELICSLKNECNNFKFLGSYPLF